MSTLLPPQIAGYSASASRERRAERLTQGLARCCSCSLLGFIGCSPRAASLTIIFYFEEHRKRILRTSPFFFRLIIGRKARVAVDHSSGSETCLPARLSHANLAPSKSTKAGLRSVYSPSSSPLLHLASSLRLLPSSSLATPIVRDAGNSGISTSC